MPRQQEPLGGAGEVATSSRRDDRSGLLDIRALSSVIDAERRARLSSASASSVALPTFTSSWALQELSAPPPAPSRPAPKRVAARDDRPLYMMIMGLTAAVACLGAYAILRPSQPAVVVEHAAVPVVVADEPEPEPEQVTEPEPEPEPALVAAAKPSEEPPDDSEQSEAKAEPKRGRAARAPRTPRSRAKTKPKPEPVAKPTKDEGVLPVECVIDPAKCSKGKVRTPTDRKDTASTKDLPATPSSSQIRSAMNEVKPRAKACASRHGGREGDKVRVKLSVEGATGRITSAKPLDEHAGTALGRCVADALAKAELPRFSKPQVGVVYAVTL